MPVAILNDYAGFISLGGLQTPEPPSTSVRIITEGSPLRSLNSISDPFYGSVLFGKWNQTFLLPLACPPQESAGGFARDTETTESDSFSLFCKEGRKGKAPALLGSSPIDRTLPKGMSPFLCSRLRSKEKQKMLSVASVSLW
jgi:hypothetical protein